METKSAAQDSADDDDAAEGLRGAWRGSSSLPPTLEVGGAAGAVEQSSERVSTSAPLGLSPLTRERQTLFAMDGHTKTLLIGGQGGLERAGAPRGRELQLMAAA